MNFFPYNHKVNESWRSCNPSDLPCSFLETVFSFQKDDSSVQSFKELLMKPAPASPQEVKLGLDGEPTSDRTPVVIAGLNQVFRQSKQGNTLKTPGEMAFIELQMPTSESMPMLPHSGTLPPTSSLNSHANDLTVI